MKIPLNSFIKFFLTIFGDYVKLKGTFVNFFIDFDRAEKRSFSALLIFLL